MTIETDLATGVGLNVSRETLSRLQVFVDLLVKWNVAINLVSKNTIGQVWSRHIADSVQVFEFGAAARNWVDLGSGGGFPGVVVAILAAELAPEMVVTLVEADQRKSAFLRQINQSLGLSTSVISSRIESIEPLKADVVSARALAPLSQLCAFANLHLGADGRGIFLKGKAAAAEIVDARAEWNFLLESHTSVTDPSAVVLVLRDIFHV